MKIKKGKILAYLSAILCIGTMFSPMQASASKANGKYYLGNYVPGDNVSRTLTLRQGTSFTEVSNTDRNIYKVDYPGTNENSFRVTKITSNLAGWTTAKIRIYGNSVNYFSEERSGYVNLNYCKENYHPDGLFIIPDGTNNVDGWNEVYVTLWGSGIRIYANNYNGNLNGNYRLNYGEKIAVNGNGSVYGEAAKGGCSGTVNLNYLLPSNFDNNDASKVIR